MPPTQAAAEQLWQALDKHVPWEQWGHCLVCGKKALTDPVAHLLSKDHTKKLSWLSGDQTFVQTWPCRDGQRYVFDHLSGEQRLEIGEEIDCKVPLRGSGLSGDQTAAGEGENV
jgi:hypothetical protein